MVPAFLRVILAGISAHTHRENDSENLKMSKKIASKNSVESKNIIVSLLEGTQLNLQSSNKSENVQNHSYIVREFLQEKKFLRVIFHLQVHVQILILISGMINVHSERE